MSLGLGYLLALVEYVRVVAIFRLVRVVVLLVLQELLLNALCQHRLRLLALLLSYTWRGFTRRTQTLLHCDLVDYLPLSFLRHEYRPSYIHQRGLRQQRLVGLLSLQGRLSYDRGLQLGLRGIWVLNQLGLGLIIQRFKLLGGQTIDFASLREISLLGLTS